MLLLKNDEELAGYVAYKLLSKKRWKIIGIAIKKEYRKKGFGEKLIKSALTRIEKTGPTAIIARTRESNRGSQALLTRVGFEKYRTILDDRVNGEATIWFRKK